jgi:LmbE family N-acetylglucosaminyl deacetylase
VPKKRRSSAPGIVVKRRNSSRFKLGRPRGVEALEQLVSAQPLAGEQPRVAMIVAHPDDEAIGAGALLGELEDSIVVHATDGAPRDVRALRRRGFTNRDAYAEVRRAEVIRALAIVGIDVSRIRSFGFVDGDLTFRLVELCHDVIDLLLEHDPDLVLTHPYEGGHTDHDAVAFAVHLACGILRREGVPAPVLLEFTSYHNRKGKRVHARFIERPNLPEREVGLTPDSQILKLKMFEQFVSQRECLAQFPVVVERFRLAPRYAFTAPPHEGELDYERYCSIICGEEWRARAAAALDQLRSRHRTEPTPE